MTALQRACTVVTLTTFPTLVLLAAVAYYVGRVADMTRLL